MKRGDGSTLGKIPTRLLCEVQLDVELRDAFRLFLCSREYIGSKVYIKDKIQRHILAILGFSDHQVKTYFKTLVRKGFMRTDRKGNFYAISIYTICPPEKRDNGKHKRTSQTPVSIEVILDKNKWKNFLRGQISMSASDTSTRSKRAKRDARCYAANTIQGGGNMDYVCVYKGKTLSRLEIATLSICQGVSLSNLMMLTGRSKSTVSRWRSQGQVAGYIKLDCYQPIHADLEYLPLFKVREMIIELGLAKDIDPNKLRTVMYQGKPRVMMQAPSQIAVRVKSCFYA